MFALPLFIPLGTNTVLFHVLTQMKAIKVNIIFYQFNYFYFDHLYKDIKWVIII